MFPITGLLKEPRLSCPTQIQIAGDGAMSTATGTGEFEEHQQQLTAQPLTGHEVGSAWDLCLSAEYDQGEVVAGIADWLGSPEGLRVLDCACGSGFPALALRLRGYELTCTDGSPFMLERFRRKARAAGVALEPQQVRWEQLGALYPAAFDVVLCRGCSLIYADTWDTDADPDRAVLVRAVENFVQCLRPGGRLYVDTTREEDLYGEYPQIEEHPARTIDGHTVQWREYLTADIQAGVRTWQVSLSVDGNSTSFERKSQFVPHDEFRRLLCDTGLENVGRVEIPGERYAVFVGRAPEA
jgi:SAM-dependent methyltransferase